MAQAFGGPRRVPHQSLDLKPLPSGPKARTTLPVRTPDSLVHIHDLSLSLGGRTLISGMSLDVYPGDAIAVVGDNGSGKTSFLRLVLGDIAPTAGCLRILGKEASPANAAKNSIGAVVGNPLLLDWMSVGQFLRMLIESSGRRSRKSEVHALLSQLEVDDLYSRRISTLSQGERQLVAIAISLIDSPELLILDQPSAHLDGDRRALLSRLISKRVTDRRTTIFTSYHGDDVGSANRLVNLAGLATDRA